MAQLINITSEALQATIRRLLPSQQGFGEDLQASNVIQPIIDLTPTAEGSVLPSYLQSAISTDETLSTTNNGTNDIATVPGFYRVRLRVIHTSGAGTVSLRLTELSSGSFVQVYTAGPDDVARQNTEFVVFVRPGYKLQENADTANITVQSLTTQVADVNGVLSDPQGFEPQ